MPYLIEKDDGANVCPNCDTVVYPDELGCGCGAVQPPAEDALCVCGHKKSQHDFHGKHAVPHTACTHSEWVHDYSGNHAVRCKCDEFITQHGGSYGKAES